jgi:IS6 family transposase
MMRERGLDVDHSTVFRWVRRYAPEVNKRIRQHLKMSGTSYRVDETYISVDKNAAYSDAFTSSHEEKVLPKDCILRRVKYLNNVVEQDHRFVKKKVRASQCFKKFYTAERTIEGIEASNMLKKGQVKRLAGNDARG